MMNLKSLLTNNAALLLIFLPVLLLASVQPGDKAPEFELTTIQAETVRLSQYKGEIVVLEWFNHGCPFVQKHYKSGNIQKLQQEYTEQDVIWLTIASSAPGKQGYLTADIAKELELLKNADPAAVLLDHTGTVGQLYGAQTTPHMFIIDTSGTVVYNGAIDSIRSTDVDDVAKAENYVANALDALLSGKPVGIKATKPYGCSVKY